MKPLLPACLLVVLSAGVGRADEGKTLFREQVRPLLAGKCVACHDPVKHKGGLDLSRREALLKGGDDGAAVVPGQPAKSLLLDRLVKKEMPPSNPLSDEQVDAFRRWIAAGAPYDDEPVRPDIRKAGKDWWSLQPVRKSAVPAVKDKDRVRTPIDAFVLARLETAGLGFAPEADRRTLIRRVTFDLTGLPPTPEEIDSFVSDRDPKAYEKLVDRLLDSPRYGERWARHWLDVARFAESHGYETNQLRMNAWPYRDYVIRAFNRDTPYPQFLLEQLAGDTLADADHLTQSATGFLVGGAHDVVGNQTEAGKLQQRMDDLDDIVTAVGATFLGLTVNCARCHDHKFDPISQKDYYALQAALAGVQHAERAIALPELAERRRQAAKLRDELAKVERELDEHEPLADPEKKDRRVAVHPAGNVERFRPIAARFVRLVVSATNNGIEPCIDELEVYTAEASPRNVALAGAGAKASASSVYPNSPIHRLEHINDARHGNGRSWISAERGKGWVQIEFAREEKIDRILWARDREEKYRDRLPVDYTIEVAVEPGKWTVVAGSQDRRRYDASAPRQPVVPEGLEPEAAKRVRALLTRRAELLKQLPDLGETRNVYAGTFTQPGPTHLLVRGDPLRKGEAVAPGGIEVVAPALALDGKAAERERRLALARWLGSADNPLTARVLVNRVWLYHFGQGIVDTPSDFGANGDRPSHPELLDWLAATFVENGWKLKPLHRLIVLSGAYRQSGAVNDRALAHDRGNRLLWRMAPRRLEAEAIRDAMLATSGKLDLTMGGPGYYLWEKNTNYVVVFKPKAQLGPEDFRRMVYQFKPRSQQDPTFGVFDCPDAALARPRRTVSTTVLQALNLLNSQTTLQQADFFAERLKREAGDDPARQAERAFLLAFGRRPTEKEQQAAVALVRKHGVAALGRALYNANEFLFVD